VTVSLAKASGGRKRVSRHLRNEVGKRARGSVACETLVANGKICSTGGGQPAFSDLLPGSPGEDRAASERHNQVSANWWHENTDRRRNPENRHESPAGVFPQVDPCRWRSTLASGVDCDRHRSTMHRVTYTLTAHVQVNAAICRIDLGEDARWRFCLFLRVPRRRSVFSCHPVCRHLVMAPGAARSLAWRPGQEVRKCGLSPRLNISFAVGDSGSQATDPLARFTNFISEVTRNSFSSPDALASETSPAALTMDRIADRGHDRHRHPGP